MWSVGWIPKAFNLTCGCGLMNGFQRIYLTAAVVPQFWREVVEDTEVRELIWDKSSTAQGKSSSKMLIFFFF